MAAPTVQSPAVRKAAAAQGEVLDELVGIAARHAAEAMVDTATRMVGALLDMTAAGTDAYEAGLRIRSGNLLKDNAYAFVHLAATAIELALRKDVARLAPAPATPKAEPLTLSLVPLEEMDTQLAFAAISRPFDIQHAERIAGLGVRLGSLLGRGLVRAAGNPFRPEVFLRALQEAWHEFEPDAQSHQLILPLLRPGIVFDFAPLFDALHDKLKPARERFAKTDDSAASNAARARRDAAVTQQLRQLFGSAASADPGLLVPDIPDLPQGSGSWRPSTAGGFAVGAAAAAAAPAGSGGTGTTGNPAPGFSHAAPGFSQPARGQAVPFGAVMTGPAGAASAPGAGIAAVPAQLTALSELLEKLAGAMPAAVQPGVPAQQTGAAAPHGVFYLPRLKERLPQGSLSRGDETTLDLLSRIFETVLLDEAIPQETRELIAFLQVPVLKAALKDRSFFFEETHPARRMIDLLSNAGWGQAAGADDPVYQAMRRGVDRVRTESQPEVFADAVAELEARLAEREHAEQAAIAGPIAQATRQEKQAAATRSATKAVQLRLAGDDVVALVGAFLEQRWIPVLSLAYSIEDSKPGAVDNATRAMDDLVWSVKPKANQEQRKALIKRLPALLTTLNKWLDAVQWQDAARLQFFAELAECHASIVRAPIDLSPERQFELAVEAAQQDALRRIAQEQAALDEEEAPDAAGAVLASLVRGMRVEFTGAGGTRQLKLSWVSPLRSLFIFSGAGRQEAFSLPAERLLEAVRAGSIRVLALDGVVGRVLTQAAGEAAINDPAGVPTAA